MDRSFDQRPVPRDLLARLLDYGRRAPSAGNTQGFAFVVLDTPARTARFWDLTTSTANLPGGRFDRMRRAPVIIIPLAHKQAYLDRYSEPDKAGFGLEDEKAWPVPYWEIDTAFATMSILLGATSLGLGACFFGIFSGENKLLSELGVPAGFRPIGAIALGWAAAGDVRSPSLARGRRPVAETVHWGRWGRTRVQP